MSRQVDNNKPAVPVDRVPFETWDCEGKRRTGRTAYRIITAVGSVNDETLRIVRRLVAERRV